MANSDKRIKVTADPGEESWSGITRHIGATKREVIGVARELAALCLVQQARLNTVRVTIGDDEFAHVDATHAMRWLVIHTTSPDTRELSRGAIELVAILLGTKRA